MSIVHSYLRKFNFTSSSTPTIFRKAQIVARDVGQAEIAAAFRWAIAGGFLAYWMIEPKLLSERDAAAAAAAAATSTEPSDE